MSLKKVILPVTVMDGTSYYYSYNTGGSCTAQGIFKFRKKEKILCTDPYIQNIRQNKILFCLVKSKIS